MYLTCARFRVTIWSTHPKEEHTLEPNDVARLVVDIVSDKKGSDIVQLDTRNISYLSDYFVIATSETERQLQAISDDIQKQLKRHSVLPLGVEGTTASGWVLLDYGSVIVHLFKAEMRDYYQLERLWANAPVVVRMQ
ncbi:MAG: ribosome silencing factor [Chloroflexi bacterium]|nr:ribosome silencing factor [Chloroflexota bacterium]